MNILVLDDREDGRYFLTVLFQGQGHEVVAVGNGVEALDRLRAGTFDLIVSDILMPVMDGFQFCQKVRADAALRGIPFVFFTATYTGPQDEEFALKIGADRFIRKPCEPAEFLGIIREVMECRASRPAQPAPPPLGPEDALRLYSERLVRKLEQKMLEAERVARALDEERKKFQNLVEDLPVGITLMDEDGRFLFLNPRFTSLFGYALHDLPNLQVVCDKALSDPESMAWVKRTVDQASGDPQNGNQAATPTIKVRCQDGTEKLVRIQAALLAGGNLVLTWEDVSERVRLEAKLRLAQRTEAVATLAGGIAHDFNNLLTAILGYAELAAAEHSPACPATQSLDGIRIAAHRARHLVGQILAFSRQAEQERIPLAMHQVVKEVLGLLRSTLPPSIEIREHLEPDGVVLADPTQMHQVVMNLCTNAFHAMRPKGGILEVSLKPETIAPAAAERIPGLAPGRYLHLSVRDTGCGMTPEVMARMFDPFFTTKPAGEGTGLGLSVSHGIVKSHHGAIDVSSSPGVGSTFHVYLPTVEMPAEAKPPSDRGELPKGHERILFVDDEAALIQVGKKILSLLGYLVVTRTDPREARDLFQQDPKAFDLVITDLTMPHLTGLELATELRRSRPDVPIILCSGTEIPSDVASGQSLPCLDVLQKPYSRRDLALVVRQALDRSPGGCAG